MYYIVCIAFLIYFTGFSVVSNAEEATPASTGNESVKLSKAVFDDLMKMRDDLVKLKGQADQGIETPQVVNLKPHGILSKLQTWKRKVKKEAGIDKELEELRNLMREAKVNAKSLLKTSKDGSLKAIKIIKAFVDVAFKKIASIKHK